MKNSESSRFAPSWSRSKRAFGVLVASCCAAGCAVEIEEPVEPAVSQTALSAHCDPPVPAVLAVPEGHRFAFELDAIGVQIYQCQATAAGSHAWVFQAPEADLLRRKRIAGHHYAGPTWEATDGSTVVGARLASYAADASAIPWLLLQATSNSDKGRMSDVSFIQRLDTVGGLAPAAGCDAEHVGELADVEYTATYRFYEPKRGGH